MIRGTVARKSNKESMSMHSMQKPEKPVIAEAKLVKKEVSKPMMSAPMKSSAKSVLKSGAPVKIQVEKKMNPQLQSHKKETMEEEDDEDEEQLFRFKNNKF